MSPIRPNFPLPVAQPRPVRPETRAAQRAFFEAAVNSAPAASASAPASAASGKPVRPVAAAARIAPDTSDPPQRYLRPGSLLDIKV